MSNNNIALVKENKAILALDSTKNRFKQVCGKNGEMILSSLVSATTVNPKLLECSSSSLIGAAFVAASLKLPINNSLGLTYIVPYGKVAQFQIGYKGLIQLMIRSGAIKNIIIEVVKENEYTSFDRSNGAYKIDWCDNEITRKTLKSTHYFGKLILHNGFEKELCTSKIEMELHAKTYSESYKTDIKKKTDYSYWSKDFDSMGLKTMIKKLAKFAPLSVEMQIAIEKDQATIIVENDNTEKIEYIDNIVDKDYSNFVELDNDNIIENEGIF